MSETRQTTDHILMIRPANFGFNPETADSNAFQSKDNQLSGDLIQKMAEEEFDLFVETLRDAGVKITVVEDSKDPLKPDAVFPNNWVTFHEDGRVATYPMLSKMRRLERREEIIENLANEYKVTDRIHFEAGEEQGKILEGTGSLILDRPNKIAYACLSPRTDEKLLDEFCQKMGYEKVAFHSVDQNGQEIYHTNVMMALGETFVVICLDSVKSKEERSKLEGIFEKTGKEIIEISFDQMMDYAGNMLQVQSEDGIPILVMSEQAFESLTEDQIDTITAHTNILYSPLYTIEKFGGGSARCMMAEVFLQKK
ncbi:MAG: arginine deiminase-related protein [Saprospiraceae bacterium]